MSGALTFGEFFRELRFRQGKTLRQFCREWGFDVGNTSRLERDELRAPVDPGKLARYARALGLREGTEEWQRFFDLAAVSAGRIPFEIQNERELVARLPLMCRTLQKKKLSREQLDELIELIQRY
ncbi:MAG: helix-turn-helix transcriptional regulator [Anaerolineae bacterium]|nr:helix-turn-helix transcriptional regulator [Anaerolineae bacterium]